MQNGRARAGAYNPKTSLGASDVAVEDAPSSFTFNAPQVCALSLQNVTRVADRPLQDFEHIEEETYDFSFST